jgi:hypothetical protein
MAICQRVARARAAINKRNTTRAIQRVRAKHPEWAGHQLSTGRERLSPSEQQRLQRSLQRTLASLNRADENRAALHEGELQEQQFLPVGDFFVDGTVSDDTEGER